MVKVALGEETQLKRVEDRLSQSSILSEAPHSPFPPCLFFVFLVNGGCHFVRCDAAGGSGDREAQPGPRQRVRIRFGPDPSQRCWRGRLLPRRSDQGRQEEGREG